ncbi:prestin-like protein [Leptotrombidium deliense]|uniref:Prestin-like protein n=1 Tax=Leptotrombidium deliense TaxID=299467 RepID=A0A443RXS4_9ACAR|nr:prestin-like protein [Leptotrombidium deliense]
MLIVLFYLGPLLEKLPNCVLASVIAVALKNLLLNAKEFKRYWKISKPDGAIWMVAFAGVIVMDIDLGLYFAVAFSLLILILKSSRPKSYVLGSANNSDLYVPLKKYTFANEISGIKIYQFCGPLHFANKDFFKNDLLKKTQLKRNLEISLFNQQKQLEMKPSEVHDNPVFTIHLHEQSTCESAESIYTHLIIDCSMISYCDASGAQTLRKIIEYYENYDLKVYLAACSSTVIQTLANDNFFNQFTKDKIFVSIHDSVLNAIKERKQWCEIASTELE